MSDAALECVQRELNELRAQANRQATALEEAGEAARTAVEYCRSIERSQRWSLRGGRAVRSATFFVALASLGTGCWWLSPPSALIAIGIVMGTMSVAGALRATREKKS